MTGTTDTGKREKRVVVHFVTGRRAGMRRIIGHIIYNSNDELPLGFKDVVCAKGEPVREARLVGEYPRYVLYREFTPQQLKAPKLPKAWKPFMPPPEGSPA